MGWKYWQISVVYQLLISKCSVWNKSAKNCECVSGLEERRGRVLGGCRRGCEEVNMDYGLQILSKSRSVKSWDLRFLIKAKIESAFAPPTWALAAGMMHSSNGNTDRYSGLPMDYGMHHPHHPGAPPQQHPHHPEHAHLAAHYALPPSHHPGGPIPHHAGLKRSPESAGLEMMSPSGGASSDDDEGSMHDVKPVMGERGVAGRGSSKGGGEGPPAGKKTKGRVKIKMEFIDNKLRRYTTFSKRKTGIMKKVN